MGAATSERRPQGKGRVFGTFLALALFLACIGYIAQGFFARAADGAAKQREYFGEQPLPLGLVLESATRLPTGEVLVRFTRDAADPGGPAEVFLIEYRSRAGVEALFRAVPGGEDPGLRLREWEREPSFQWQTVLKRGEIAWGPWSTKFLIERAFKKGGGWSEEARVDLSSPARALVLFARWPRDTPVEEQVLRTLLAAVQLEPAGPSAR